MGRPDTWSDEQKETLLELIKQGYSYSEIGQKIGRTVGQISGKMSRMKGYVRPNDDSQKEHHKRRRAKKVEQNNTTTHPGLVEPWAIFHARKKKEREALKAKGEFYIYQSAGRTPGKKT